MINAGLSEFVDLVLWRKEISSYMFTQLGHILQRNVFMNYVSVPDSTEMPKYPENCYQGKKNVVDNFYLFLN